MTNILASIVLMVATNEVKVGTATYNSIPSKTYDLYSCQIQTNEYLRFRFRGEVHLTFLQTYLGPTLPEKRVEQPRMMTNYAWGVYVTNNYIPTNYVWTNAFGGIIFR